MINNLIFKQKKTIVKVKLKANKEDKLMTISSPINFEHTLHVHLNSLTGEFIVIIRLFLFFF